MFGFGDRPARAREKAARKARGPLADFYAVPLQPPETSADALRLLAIDVETTGLDPKTCAVLSIGFLPVEGHDIVLGGASGMVVAAGEVGQSAVIHGLTDDVVAAGVPMEQALTRTLAALAGRVLLAHHHLIETEFLSRACEQHFGAPLVVPAVDTMLIEHGLLSAGFDAEPRRDELRLWNARARYGLPRYAAHGALTDALACAELYQAQLTRLSGEPTLRSLSA